LRVSSPLSASQDAEQKNMLVSGTSNVYPFLIPVEGDMFIADIGDGNAGIFRVTASTRKSLFKDTCYEIEYVLQGYVNETNVGDLEAKVVRSVYYVDDFAQHGQDPFLEVADYNAMRVLNDRYKDLADLYLRMFCSREFKTLLVPGQQQSTYDPFMLDAVKAFISSRDSYRVVDVRKLNCDGDIGVKSASIWDVLLTRDPYLLEQCCTRVTTVSTRNFSAEPMFEGIRFSGINRVVYPIDPFVNIDYSYSRQLRPASLGGLTPTSEVTTNGISALRHEVSIFTDEFVDALDDLSESLQVFDIMVQNKDITAEDALLQNDLENTEEDSMSQQEFPLIWPVTLDDYYVFSESFYAMVRPRMSKLEVCIANYLEKKPIDLQILLELATKAPRWGGLERFYYIPAILILIKSAIRSF